MEPKRRLHGDGTLYLEGASATHRVFGVPLCLFQSLQIVGRGSAADPARLKSMPARWPARRQLRGEQPRGHIKQSLSYENYSLVCKIKTCI